jgi:hypothetical protein
VSGGLFVDAGHDFGDQVGSFAGLNFGQSPSLHRRPDQPGAAAAAGFKMGIDLLREHLGALTVQSSRQRFTRDVTPHLCIVAYGWSARKDSRNIALQRNHGN